MKRYQIVETSENHAHAGSKATSDVAAIADGLGYERVMVQMKTTKPGVIAKIRRQIGWKHDWRMALKTIEPGSIVLLQHPFHYPQLTREKTLRKLKQKGCTFIGVIHDVEELRKFRDSEYYHKEFATTLELDDWLIVHNEVMKEFFIKKGYPAKRLIVLGIFDYLQDHAPVPENLIAGFEPSITVAGNLDVTKCGYLAGLSQLAAKGVKVNLYGPNYNATLMENDNIIYHGVFPADEIPSKLDRGFGLVWDGSSIEGCVGDSGQYLRYNNPHKLSLYLSSGLPVVIWKQAALADFVAKEGVGILVDTLMELPAILSNMEVLEYSAMRERAVLIGKRLREGAYAKEALEKI